MASEILMPRLGWTMEEGTFGEWLKKDGDTVKAGDLLFTVESDKATQEVEAFDSGILRIGPDGPQPGAVLPVGALMGYIVAPGEDAPFATASAPQPTTAAANPAAQPSEPPTTNHAQPAPRKDAAKIAISPRARRVANELGVDWQKLTGSGATGRIVERDVRAAAAQAPAEMKVRATPVAQRMAQEAGIDLAALAQQKGNERIERADVEAAIATRSAAPSAAPVVAEADVEVVATSRIRRVTAQRMAESAHTVAPVTLTTEADATALVALREELKATFTPRNWTVPSYNDLLIKLTAIALQAHPTLNATWHETEIHLSKVQHIGLAVDTAEGLFVPVVRNVQAKSVRQIADETRSLIVRAQGRQLGVDEMQGGTFTITNLGMFGIDAFTPIINLPQTAILGVGRIVKKPAVVNDQIVPRHMVALSLTFDHRAVDGAPAARFLNAVREFIETPTLWLVG